MIAKNKRLRKRVRAFSRTFIYLFLGVLILAVVGFLVDANIKISKKRSQLAEQINYLENQLRELQKQKAQYEQGLSSAQTAEFWEERLREQGYQKPGEGVYVVVPSKEAIEQEVVEEKSFWQKLLEKLRF